MTDLLLTLLAVLALHGGAEWVLARLARTPATPAARAWPFAAWRLWG